MLDRGRARFKSSLTSYLVPFRALSAMRSEERETLAGVKVRCGERERKDTRCVGGWRTEEGG